MNVAIPKPLGLVEQVTSSSSPSTNGGGRASDERGQEPGHAFSTDRLGLSERLGARDHHDALGHEQQLSFGFEEAALANAVPTGRLVELSVGGMTTAVSFVTQAQAKGEPTAWVQPEGGTLFPPDLADSGVDLESLIVVHVPGRPHELIRATELLLRSGAFGLVVLDLTEGLPRGGSARWQGRLSALVREHRARVVVLSRRDAESARGQASLGPLMSLRVATHRESIHAGEAPHVLMNHEVLKDKVGVGEPRPLLRALPLGLEGRAVGELPARLDRRVESRAQVLAVEETRAQAKRRHHEERQ